MKNIISILITGLFMLEAAMAQETPPRFIPNTSFEKDKAFHSKPKTADYFLQKSSDLQNSAGKLACIGAVLGVSGLLLHEAGNNSQNQMGAAEFYTGGGMFLLLAGTSLIVISIPLYFESVHYKNKAMAMNASLGFQSFHDLNKTGLVLKQYPAFSLKINL